MICDGDEVRLVKYLREVGLGSRRYCEGRVGGGGIEVNGEECLEFYRMIRVGKDRVSENGRELRIKERRTVILNKPVGYMSSRRAEFGRRTVYDLMGGMGKGLYHIGRLDYGSEGLMILTDEGYLGDRVMHPRYGVEKEYFIVVEGGLGFLELERLRGGVRLEEGEARCEWIYDIEGGFRLCLKQGWKRQIRRMVGVLGKKVKILRRERIGGIELGGLGMGEWRFLKGEELEWVRGL